MTVFDLKTHAHIQDKVRATVCVIGGGMAGLTLALRLARGGEHVVVLESGGQSFDPEVHELNQLDDVCGRYTRAMDGHYRGLGGSSTRWGGRMVPISPAELRRREAVGLPAWPLAVEELARYHGEIEDLFGVGHGSFDEAALAEIDPDGIVPRKDPDFVARWAKWPTFRHCSFANLFGPRLRNEANLDVWLNATVCGFEVDPAAGRLRSVTARNTAGRKLTVAAEHFIVASGTIESTRLLLWLDASHDSRIFARSPALGRYLQDHVNVRVAEVRRADARFAGRFCAYRFQPGTRRSLHLEFSPEAQSECGVASAFAYFNVDLEGSALDAVKRFGRSLQARDTTPADALETVRNIPFLIQLGWARYVEKRLFLPEDVRTSLDVCAEQLPDERNLIGLSDRRDPLGLPRARLEWRPMAADERTLQAVVHRLADYWHRHDLGRPMPLEWSKACQPGARLIDHAVDYAHPSGTIRMGTVRNSSVVGADLVCRDVPNLSVVSAAVFPSAGSANPTFTLLALAMRHADQLLASRARAFTPTVPAAGPVRRPQPAVAAAASLN